MAKKLWCRGDRATARDLFDLALVIEREPNALASAREYLICHREARIRRIVTLFVGIGWFRKKRPAYAG